MFFAPAVAFAQVTDADSLAARLINLGNLFVYVLISLAIIYLIFGVVKYLIAGGDEGKEKGKDIIIRGVVGLAVIFSIWGLVALLIRVVNLGDGSQIKGKVPKANDLLGTPPSVR